MRLSFANKCEALPDYVSMVWNWKDSGWEVIKFWFLCSEGAVYKPSCTNDYYSLDGRMLKECFGMEQLVS